ncbi:MAG: selenocysteine-specific translation elongation factor [Thermovirgaceae bacterium]
MSEYPVVLGTAGHIDHGKTTLIRALTGVDCDRLRDEKKRGITIELGFAPMELPGGRVVSVVDVPGHERFIRQMVAGVAGIDGVIFTVAADEGVKAQTREHLEILGLLGVEKGVIVVTKADAVDGELLELAVEEIKDEVRGTFLEKMPLATVSALRGTGLERLRELIGEMVGTLRKKNPEGAFFMPIDRAFQVKGFGTVVTGTAYRGKVQVNDALEIMPLGKRTYARSIQIHDKPVNEATAGQRTALSLADIAMEDLSRGDNLCAEGIYRPTQCLDITLKLLPSTKEPLKHWQRVRLHTGTSDVLARVFLLDQKAIEPGGEGFAQLLPEEPLAASIDQAFILRFYSPLRTIGGGRILSPEGRRPKGKKARESYRIFLEDLSKTRTIDERLHLFLLRQKFGTIADLATKIQEEGTILSKRLQKMEQKGEIVLINAPDLDVMIRSCYAETAASARKILGDLHDKQPENPGMSVEDFSRRLLRDFHPRAAKKLIDKFIADGYLEETSQRLHLPGFVPEKEGTLNERANAILSYCRGKGVNMADVEELRNSLEMKEKHLKEALDMLKVQKKLFTLQGGYVIDRHSLSEVVKTLSTIDGDITIGAVRDATGSSRKFILPILELLDSMGITRRVQEKRILRKLSID